MTPYILVHKTTTFCRLSHVVPVSNIMLYLHKHRTTRDIESLQYLADKRDEKGAYGLPQLDRYCCGIAADTLNAMLQ